MTSHSSHSDNNVKHSNALHFPELPANQKLLSVTAIFTQSAQEPAQLYQINLGMGIPPSRFSRGKILKNHTITPPQNLSSQQEDMLLDTLKALSNDYQETIIKTFPKSIEQKPNI